MRQMTDDRQKGLGRSFMKGPRFFVKPSQQNCCEQCVYGSGKHTCATAAQPDSDRSPQSTRPTPGKP